MCRARPNGTTKSKTKFFLEHFSQTVCFCNTAKQNVPSTGKVNKFIKYDTKIAKKAFSADNSL